MGEDERRARSRYEREPLPNQYGGEARWDQLSADYRASLVRAEGERR